MTNQEYIKALDIIETERLKKIEALNTTWALFNGDKPLPKAINSHDDAVEAIRNWRRGVDRAVRRMPKHFTIKDMRDLLAQEGVETDLSAVSTYLKKLASEGTLEIIDPGRGGKKTVYSAN